MTRHLWIHFVVLILAAASIATLGTYFYEAYYIYSLYQMKHAPEEERDFGTMNTIYAMIAEKNFAYNVESEIRKREKLTAEEKHLLDYSFYGNAEKTGKPEKPQSKSNENFVWVDPWNIAIFGGSLIQLTGTVLYLFDLKEKSATSDVFMGLGSFFAWVNITSYLRIYPEYYGTFFTLFKSIPTIFKYLMSVLPIFIGCGFLCCCIFWSSEFFSSPSKAFYSEFALYLCDIVIDSSDQLPNINYAFANIYIYGNIIFFLFVAQTILMAIITKTYSHDVTNKESESRGEEAKHDKDTIIREIAVCEFCVSYNSFT